LRKVLARTPSPEERATLRARFVAGAIGNDVAQPVAEQLWETLVGYTGFGFVRHEVTVREWSKGPRGP
jgi:DNA polymerase III alpha subunit